MPNSYSKSRQDLRSRFVRNAIPSEADFADLIAASLNQADDGVLKLPDQPLGLVRQKPAQPVLRFFADPAAEGSAWELQLGSGEKPGFGLAAADGKLALFVDGATGNVGIGTVSPGNRLTVQGAFNESKDPESGIAHGGLLALKGNAPQIDFIDTEHGDWSIHVNEGKMYFIREPWEHQDLVLDGRGNVGIGTRNPVAKLQITGNASIASFEGKNYACMNNFMSPGSLTIGGIDRNFGGGTGWNANTAGLLLETRDNTEIAVHDSGSRVASFMYYEGSKNRFTIGRDMGWGGISEVHVQGSLRVNGRIDSQNASIQAAATDPIRQTADTWTDMPQMIVSTEIDGPVFVLFKVGGVQGGPGKNVRARFRLLIDNNEKSFTLHEFHNEGWELRDVTLIWLESLAAGNHTFKIQWRAEGGTVSACLYKDLRSLVIIRL